MGRRALEAPGFWDANGANWSTIRFRSITWDCSVNALGWIRLQFALFASPQFSKQERVSGVSAVSAVSAAPRFAGASRI